MNIDDMEPGKELDALIAEKIMGWKFRKPTHGSCCTCQRCGRDYDTCNNAPCDFSADLAAAWSVVEKVNDNANDVVIEVAGDGIIEVVMGWFDMEGWSHFQKAKGKSAPHAICLAALKAVNEQ